MVAGGGESGDGLPIAGYTWVSTMARSLATAEVPDRAALQVDRRIRRVDDLDELAREVRPGPAASPSGFHGPLRAGGPVRLAVGYVALPFLAGEVATRETAGGPAPRLCVEVPELHPVLGGYRELPAIGAQRGADTRHVRLHVDVQRPSHLSGGGNVVDVRGPAPRDDEHARVVAIDFHCIGSSARGRDLGGDLPARVGIAKGHVSGDRGGGQHGTVGRCRNPLATHRFQHNGARVGVEELDLSAPGNGEHGAVAEVRKARDIDEVWC